MKKKKKVNPLFEQCKELISLFLNDGFNWGNEIKIAKSLLKKYPIEFWRQYKINQRFFSLSAFLTSRAKAEVDKEYNFYLLSFNKKPIKLEEKPVIEINFKKEKKLARTLIEFLDGY